MTEKLSDPTEARMKLLEEELAATVAAWEEAGAAMKIASDLAQLTKAEWARLGEKRRALEGLLGVKPNPVKEPWSLL